MSAIEVEAQMFIRCPAAAAYTAFVDPAITTRFWFTRASGPLTQGATIRWDWECFGVGTDVRVIALEPARRIEIEWDDPPCPVRWQFAPHGADATLVTITNSGFHGDADAVLAQALDAKGGFTVVLAGAKAWLEHGIALNLVRDQFPPAGGSD